LEHRVTSKSATNVRYSFTINPVTNKWHRRESFWL
jgi:hypothetical protein